MRCTIAFGQFYLISRLNKYLLKKTSKASYISIVIIVILLLLFIASSILYTKATTKSIAAFFGRIPLYYGLNSPEVNII
jgi:multisubunit Na+/H+ antiporter MnhB subunit